MTWAQQDNDWEAFTISRRTWVGLLRWWQQLPTWLGCDSATNKLRGVNLDRFQEWASNTEQAKISLVHATKRGYTTQTDTLLRMSDRRSSQSSSLSARIIQSAAHDADRVDLRSEIDDLTRIPAKR